MARLGDFIAFRAAISLLKKTTDGKEIIKNTYKECKKEQTNNNQNQINHLKKIYAPFTQEEISKEIALLLKTDNISTDFDILFQTKEGLRVACPDHTGDWYFTGDYPTSGGNMVANRSFIYYVEGNESRAY